MKIIREKNRKKWKKIVGKARYEINKHELNLHKRLSGKKFSLKKEKFINSVKFPNDDP